MTYRTFTEPDSWRWRTGDWATWCAEQGLLLDVRADIPQGVCSDCFGGTGTYEETTMVPAGPGLVTPHTETRRWPRCYQCGHFDGLDGILPISYSLYDRLESAIARAKDDPSHEWLNIPLASILHTFLAHHLGCIEDRWGAVDVITVVPSHVTARGGWDHMKDLIGRVHPWPKPERWDLDLLEKIGRSDADERRRGEPQEDLFLARDDMRPINGMRVLLLDDTYTTGGTLRSAGLALQAAGAHPIAVTIGRQVRRDKYGGHIVADAAARRPLFDPSRCALESTTWSA